jgi:hypothetical protein
MGMQISRCIYTKVSSEKAVWRIKKRSEGLFSQIMLSERMSDRRGVFDAGSCSYVVVDTAKIFSIAYHRIFKREDSVVYSAAVWEKKKI